MCGDVLITFQLANSDNISSKVRVTQDLEQA